MNRIIVRDDLLLDWTIMRDSAGWYDLEFNLILHQINTKMFRFWLHNPGSWPLICVDGEEHPLEKAFPILAFVFKVVERLGVCDENFGKCCSDLTVNGIAWVDNKGAEHKFVVDVLGMNYDTTTKNKLG